MSLSKSHHLFKQASRFSEAVFRCRAAAKLMNYDLEGFMRLLPDGTWSSDDGDFYIAEYEEQQRDSFFVESLSLQRHAATVILARSAVDTSSPADEEPGLSAEFVPIDIPLPPGTTNIRHTPRRPGAPSHALPH
jgi:hypothetical protein